MNALKTLARTVGTRLIRFAETAPVQTAAAPVSTARIAVKSSVIMDASFIPTHHHNIGTVLLAYTNGDLYEYRDVERADFDALMTAESKGTHLNRVFKPQYAGHKIDL